MDRQTPPPDGVAHEALIYSSDEELLSFAVPYLTEGLEAGEHTTFFADEATNALVADAMRHDPRLHVLPQLPPETRPARTYSMCQDLVTRRLAAGAPGVRLVGRPNFTGTPEQRERWCRYEAIVNHALAGTPVAAICLYDTRSDPAEVVDVGLRTHPLLSAPARPNPAYEAMPAHLREDAVPRPPAEPTVELLGVADAAGARRAVTVAILAGRRPSEAREDFVTALAEVVENAVRHGRPPVDVRVWTGGGSLVAEVVDRGRGIDDRMLGYRPLRPAELRSEPLGLWLARRLCDDLDYRRTADGFTVRLRSFLPDAPSPD